MGTDDCCCGRFNTAQGTRIVAVASATISVFAFIGFSARFIQLSVAGSWKPEQSSDGENPSQAAFGNTTPTTNEGAALLKRQNDTTRLLVGVFAGISVVSFLVALLLTTAVKRGNRLLALPFMVWTILCTAAAGMYSIMLLVIFTTSSSVTSYPVLDLVPQFVVVVVMFKLYTWWLIVVFNFYNRITFSVGGQQTFDGMEMQSG